MIFWEGEKYGMMEVIGGRKEKFVIFPMTADTM